MSIKWSKSEKPILLLKSVISTQYLDKNGENFVNTTYPNVCQNLPTWSALNREPDAYEPIGITCPAKINIMTFSQKNKKRKRHKITRVMSLKST